MTTKKTSIRALALLAGGIWMAAPPPEAGSAPPTRGFARMTERVHDSAAASYAERFGVSLELARLIHAEATRQELEPALAFALVETESGFDPAATGRLGEVGLTQVRPYVARAYGRVGPEELRRPVVNLRYGLTHLRSEMDHFGTPELGLLAYNMGRTRLASHLAAGRVPPGGYARRVLERCGPTC